MKYLNQLTIILNRLINLKENKISLKDFTSSSPYYFPDLFDDLDIDDDDWFDECNKEWWQIETIYSCYKHPSIKYENLSEFDKNFIKEHKDDKALNEAINNLIKLVKSKIN